MALLWVDIMHIFTGESGEVNQLQVTIKKIGM